MSGEEKKIKAWCESRTKDNSRVVDEKLCLMKGEKELVMDEGIDGRGQKRRGKEAQQKSLLYIIVISLLALILKKKAG